MASRERNLLFLFTLIYVIHEINTQTTPNYLPFFQNNKENSGLPRSYYLIPGYFESVPASERPHNVQHSEVVPSCNYQEVSADNLNAYEFQTEEMLTAVGLNLYDGACWSIAMSVLGSSNTVLQYTLNTLFDHKTLQFPNIKGDRPCAGRQYPYGDCVDVNHDGACGFCYGNDLQTMTIDHAYFFRMISDYWCLEGTVDARCPELGNPWCWNEYTPVTGENGWANLIGPLQSSYIAANYNADGISVDSPTMLLATRFITAVQAMVLPNGGVYYAPYNTYNVKNPDVGSTVSTENNASLLAGLQILYDIINGQTSSRYKSLLPTLETLITGITSYIKLSYDPVVNYFRQGGSYDLNTGDFTWVTEPFASDCQTWVITVIGKEVIDGWFGDGTCLSIWEETKKISGYNYHPETNWVEGIGFSMNIEEQVFSGEWTLGGSNMLRALAYGYYNEGSTAMGDELIAEAQYMINNVRSQLTYSFQFPNTVEATAILYANKRYYIPFGWWANPLPSMASTAWMQMLDSEFNPFSLGGGYNNTWSSLVKDFKL